MIVLNVVCNNFEKNFKVSYKNIVNVLKVHTDEVIQVEHLEIKDSTYIIENFVKEVVV